jgi:hypothetical protein
MQSDEISRKIRAELSRMGWSISDFVREYDKYHSYNSRLTSDSLKKQLSRKTTIQPLLKTYLDFIYQHEAWRKIDNVKPIFVGSLLEDDFISEMSNISRNITRKLKNDL